MRYVIRLGLIGVITLFAVATAYAQGFPELPALTGNERIPLSYVNPPAMLPLFTDPAQISSYITAALNAKVFGATGNGVTNDGPALAKALAGCSITAPLYLPPGKYETRQPLTVPAGCRFYGDNSIYTYYTGSGGRQPGAVIIGDNSTSGFSGGQAVLSLTNNTSEVDRIAVFGIASGPGSPAFQTAGGTLKNVLGANGTDGLLCPNGSVATVLDSEFALNAVGINASCPDFIARTNYIHGNTTYGGYAGGQVKATWEGNIFEWNGGNGLFLDGRFAPLSLVNVIANVFDRNTAAGLNLDTTVSVVAAGNTFRRNNAGGAGGAQIAFADTNLGLQMGGNTYLSAHINDDGSGIVAPDYVYTAAGGSTFSGGITDDPVAQNVGIYSSGTQALMAGVNTAGITIGGSPTITGTWNFGGGVNFQASPYLANGVALRGFDTGAVAHTLLQYFSDNAVYLDGGAAGLIIRPINGATNTLDYGVTTAATWTAAAPTTINSATFKVTTLAAGTAIDTVCYTTVTGLFTEEPTGTTCTVSDERLKSPLQPISDRHSLDIIMGSKPSSFYFLPGTPNDDGNYHFGFGAQTLAKVAPELTLTDDDGVPNRIKYGELTPITWAAIQEQQRQIETLKLLALWIILFCGLMYVRQRTRVAPSGRSEE